LLLAHPASTVIHVHNTHPSTINSIVINLTHAENDVLASLIQDIDCAGLVVLVFVDNCNAVLLAGFVAENNNGRSGYGSFSRRLCRDRDGRRSRRCSQNAASVAFTTSEFVAVHLGVGIFGC
jgi:hypothetical protein